MKVKNITIHCSATQNLPSITKDVIKKWHTDKGWSDIGYHAVIETSGMIRFGRPPNKTGAHVFGHNKDNYGICLVGGVDSAGKSVMNFNEKQLNSLNYLLTYLKHTHKLTDENIRGHRDWFKDTDNDGVITRKEWLKDCPCMDVRTWLSSKVAIFDAGDLL